MVEPHEIGLKLETDAPLVRRIGSLDRFQDEKRWVMRGFTNHRTNFKESPMWIAETAGLSTLAAVSMGFIGRRSREWQVRLRRIKNQIGP
jgi:hypothetical protein